MAREKEDHNDAVDQFLSSIDTRIAALQALRASYLAAKTMGAFGPTGGEVGTLAPLAAHPMELPRGAFLGKSLPNAIKLYLSSVKRKQTIKEIANALRAGGVETTAKNFETPISSAINRLKASGEVLRFNDGWALSEFYPESLRAKLSEKSAKTAKTKTREKPKTMTITISLDTRVLNYMKRNPESSFTTSEIAEAMLVEPKLAGMAIARLARYNKIKRSQDGSYSAA